MPRQPPAPFSGGKESRVATRPDYFERTVREKDTERGFVTMIETLTLVKRFTAKARELDPLLITGGRAAIVGRNLGQIEGRLGGRGRVYVHRLAGKSADVVRKSRTEMAVEWLGATAFENTHLLDTAEEFFTTMFAAARTVKPIVILRDFWTIDEESESYHAARRTAYVSGDMARVTDLTLRLQRNEQEIAELQRVGTLAR